MGSFNMNCSVTNYSFTYDDEAILIPILVNSSNYKKPIYMHDNVKVAPLYVDCKYYDYGLFEVTETDISKRLLSILGKMINQDDEDDSLDWETFFELCHERSEVKGYRLSYAAIHKSVFDNVLNNYHFDGVEDNVVDGKFEIKSVDFDFEIFLKSCIKKQQSVKLSIEQENKKIEDAILLLEAQGNSSLADVLKGSMQLTTKHNPLLSRVYPKHFFGTTDLNQTITEGEFENYAKIRFLDCFLSGINKPWHESVYADQEIDTVGFKVLLSSMQNLLE